MLQPGAAERCRDALHWFADAGRNVVHVAGPRESESPGIGETAEKFLREVFQHPGSEAMLENCPPSATAFVTTRSTP
jgi:hypothetical protein